MASLPATSGRHRLGRVGLQHCTAHPEVATTLQRIRRPWLTSFFTTARHAATGVRARPQVTEPMRWASPVPAT